MANKAKTPAERKRDQRQREADLGAKRVTVMFYRGSLKCIDELCKARGLTETDRVAELITGLIHEAHKSEVVTGHEV